MLVITIRKREKKKLKIRRSLVYEGVILELSCIFLAKYSLELTCRD